MNKTQSTIVVECDLDTDLPLLPTETDLVKELLPELVKDMLWLLEDKE